MVISLLIRRMQQWIASRSSPEFCLTYLLCLLATHDLRLILHFATTMNTRNALQIFLTCRLKVFFIPLSVMYVHVAFLKSQPTMIHHVQVCRKYRRLQTTSNSLAACGNETITRDKLVV